MATSGYEKMLLHQLGQFGIDAAVVNPRRVRDFAKGIGIDAKTNAIDTAVISHYCQVVQPATVACKSDHEKKHRALVNRRNQLLDVINLENNRLTHWRFPDASLIRLPHSLQTKKVPDFSCDIVGFRGFSPDLSYFASAPEQAVPQANTARLQLAGHNEPLGLTWCSRKMMAKVKSKIKSPPVVGQRTPLRPHLRGRDSHDLVQLLS